MRSDGLANRERILLAAEDVFGLQGHVGTTDAVAKQAGVGIGTVFRHFPTKQELIEATAVRFLQHLEREARDLLENEDPPHALAVLLRSLVAKGAIKINLLQLLKSEGCGVTPAVVGASRAWHDAIQNVITRAQSVGAAGLQVTVNDVLLLVTALAHASLTADKAGLERVIVIVLNGLGVPTIQPQVP